VSFPSFCVIAQGSKELLLGDSLYRYNPAQYLISTAALPIASRVTEASPKHPYLGIVLKLDPALIGSVLVEAGHRAPRNYTSMTAIDVSPLDTSLLDAVVRLVRLLDSPTEVRFFAPLVMREIVYRLMLGAQGSRLHQIAALGGATHRIAEAIERLRNDFDQSLRIEESRARVGDEHLRLPPPLPSAHGDEPAAIPEAASAPGGPPAHARRGPSTPPARATAWDTAIPHTSPASTSDSSVIRRCVTSNGCGKATGQAWVKQHFRSRYVIVPLGYCVRE